MPATPRRRLARAHALRLDPPALLQAGLAASITLFVAWLTQSM